MMNSHPVLIPHAALIARAIEISSRTRSAYYDCLYVALTERERCQLVTADQKPSIISCRASRSLCRWRHCRDGMNNPLDFSGKVVLGPVGT